MSWKNGSITSLNRAIKFLKRWESRAFKSYDDPFIKTQIGDISFEDFCEQYRKNYFFTLVDYFRYWKESLSEIEERVKMEEKPYKVNLENLLKRYAVNGLTKFEKADDLNVYTGQSGIYIFCLDEIRGYYIGQTTTDIKTRIKRHWSEPSNTFDRTYGPKDVSAIYVLRLKTKYLNRVEQDCIANINEKYLLNGFVGGNVIAGVHSAWYNSGDYKLGQDELNEVLVGID